MDCQKSRQIWTEKRVLGHTMGHRSSMIEEWVDGRNDEAAVVALPVVTLVQILLLHHHLLHHHLLPLLPCDDLKEGASIPPPFLLPHPHPPWQ